MSRELEAWEKVAIKQLQHSSERIRDQLESDDDYDDTSQTNTETYGCFELNGFMSFLALIWHTLRYFKPQWIPKSYETQRLITVCWFTILTICYCRLKYWWNFAFCLCVLLIHGVQSYLDEPVVSVEYLEVSANVLGFITWFV